VGAVDVSKVMVWWTGCSVCVQKLAYSARTVGVSEEDSAAGGNMLE
jgi:hypothetical protein